MNVNSPNWLELYRDLACDRGDEMNDLVFVTREAARLGAAMLKEQMEREYYHTHAAAWRDLAEASGEITPDRAQPFNEETTCPRCGGSKIVEHWHDAECDINCEIPDCPYMHTSGIADVRCPDCGGSGKAGDGGSR